MSQTIQEVAERLAPIVAFGLERGHKTLIVNLDDLEVLLAARASLGTYACPICERDTPHRHWQRGSDDLPSGLLSLWPRTWDQQHNRTRSNLIQQQTEQLVAAAGGDEVKDFNLIMDALDADDYAAFVRLVTLLADKLPENSATEPR